MARLRQNHRHLVCYVYLTPLFDDGSAQLCIPKRPITTIAEGHCCGPALLSLSKTKDPTRRGVRACRHQQVRTCAGAKVTRTSEPGCWTSPHQSSSTACAMPQLLNQAPRPSGTYLQDQPGVNYGWQYGASESPNLIYVNRQGSTLMSRQISLWQCRSLWSAAPGQLLAEPPV